MRTYQEQYHSHSFRSHWKRPEPGDVGIEIELYATAKEDLLEKVNEGVVDEALAFAAEYDGSLSYERGVELISPPIPYEEAVSSEGMVGRMLERINGLYSAPSTNYGMHLSFNHSTWPDRVTSDVITFIRSCATLGTLIGRRPPGYNGYTASCTIRHGRIEPVTHRNRGLVATTAGSSRLEVRLFLCPSDFNDVRIGLQYVNAVKEFVENNPWWAWYAIGADLTQVREGYGTYLTSTALEELFREWITSTSSSVDRDTLLQYLELSVRDVEFDPDFTKLLTAYSNWRTVYHDGHSSQSSIFGSFPASLRSRVEEIETRASANRRESPPQALDLGVLDGRHWCRICSVYHLEHPTGDLPSIEQAARAGHPEALRITGS